MNAEPDRNDEEQTADTANEPLAERESTVEPGGQPGAEDGAEIAAAGCDGDDKLSALQAKADENWDKYLRTAAEMENVRKRAARDVEKAHKFALERFATDILAVSDSLEMALATEGEVSVESLKDGNQATLKLLGAVMSRFGVEELDPLGEPFDPSMHEAISMQPSDTAEPGSVLTVFQKGYALNGRLLRPARVVVVAEAE